jgi:hypothetical protein
LEVEVLKQSKTKDDGSRITQRLVLRGMKVDELRALGARHLPNSPDGLNAAELREQLAAATENSALLRKELAASPFSFKPSFYLMIANVHSDMKSMMHSVTKLRQVFFDRSNSDLTKDSNAPLKGFSILDVSNPADGVLELQVTWHHIMHYLSVDAKYEHVYALKAGFVFVDIMKEKALFCCHTINERDILAKACKRHLDVAFSPISLTKQLLSNIGSFEAVRRAGYLTSKPDANESEQVTYVDEKLWKKADALRRENDTASARKHSFYRVDLGNVAEAGVGVTSDTAKFWISSDTPVETTREYGLLLLKKFTSTLKKMKEAGDIPGILNVLSIDKSPALSSVAGPELRQGITELAHQLVQMLIKQESERPFSPSDHFLTEAIPSLFNPARIQLFDEDHDLTNFWSNANNTSQLVTFALKNGKWSAREFVGKTALNLSQLRQPLTGQLVAISDPVRSVELWPTPKLHEILLQIISQVGVELPKLKKVRALPFHISAGRLVIDLANSVEETFSSSLKEEIDPQAIRQFRVALRQKVTANKGNKLAVQLAELKEKCAHMTDDNCENCLEYRQFVCLRSLLARFLVHPQLGMHKGIELSDLEGTIDVGENRCRVWFFSKIGSGGKGLTLRNTNGAILLAQIINQIDKSTFDVVGILTPSTVNQDLKERIIFLSGLMKKKVLIVRKPILEKLLMYFEEQNDFEKKDVRKVYSASKLKRTKGKRDQTVGAFA